MLLSLNGFLQYFMFNCLDINTSTKREAVTPHPDVIRARNLRTRTAKAGRIDGVTGGLLSKHRLLTNSVSTIKRPKTKVDKNCIIQKQQSHQFICQDAQQEMMIPNRLGMPCRVHRRGEEHILISCNVSTNVCLYHTNIGLTVAMLHQA
jgi:hypothetical protein